MFRSDLHFFSSSFWALSWSLYSPRRDAIPIRSWTLGFQLEIRGGLFQLWPWPRSPQDKHWASSWSSPCSGSHEAPSRAFSGKTGSRSWFRGPRLSGWLPGVSCSYFCCARFCWLERTCCERWSASRPPRDPASSPGSFLGPEPSYCSAHCVLTFKSDQETFRDSPPLLRYSWRVGCPQSFHHWHSGGCPWLPG
ncbi:hypothetical protein NOCA2340023 [metagenome]|uniref:Uncharacterized protein n=1 Tax=metagenome TaxID=256318 RepID=A0A2P2C347_9ZZZZ